MHKFASPVRAASDRKWFDAALWLVQIALCLLYLFTGGSKLTMLPSVLHSGGSLFFPFLGLCEFLGAIGLILPSVLRIATRLTPIASAGLAIIMVGAVSSLALAGARGLLWLPISALVGDIFVLIGRTQLVPIGGRQPRTLSTGPPQFRDRS